LVYSAASHIRSNYDYQLFKTTLFQQSKIVNGITGNLHLSEDGFREDGEYHQATAIFDQFQRVWENDYIIKYKSSSPNYPFFFSIQQVVNYELDYRTTFEDCNDYNIQLIFSTNTGENFISSIDKTQFEALSDPILHIPLFSDLIIASNCDGSITNIICPADVTSKFTSCFIQSTNNQQKKNTHLLKTRELDRDSTDFDLNQYISVTQEEVKDNKESSLGLQNIQNGEVNIEVKEDSTVVITEFPILDTPQQTISTEELLQNSNSIDLNNLLSKKK
jgi:hypothetical protein